MSLASIRRWTRWLPMKPAPPVMHTRFPLRAIVCRFSCVVSVLVIAEREELVFRNAELDEAGELRARAFERRDDHQIVGDLLVRGDRVHWYAEKLMAVALVEDRHRLEPGLPQRQVRQFRRFAAPVNRDATIRGRAFGERLPQMLTDLAVEMQRVIHEFVRQARLLGDAAR